MSGKVYMLVDNPSGGPLMLTSMEISSLYETRATITVGRVTGTVVGFYPTTLRDQNYCMIYLKQERGTKQVLIKVYD